MIEDIKVDDDALPEDWRMRAEAAERLLDQVRQDSNERLKRAELKIEAVRAGMIDLDGLKLIDFDQVALGEDGSVADAGSIMVKLKRAKPWLFGVTSSSSTAGVPRVEPPRARHARDLSETEWRAERAELLRRSGG